MSDNRRPHMLPGSPGLFQTQGTPYSIPPFPVTGQNHSPQAEDGDLPSVPEQKFYGERGPGGGGRFSKSALLSRKTSPPPQKLLFRFRVRLSGGIFRSGPGQGRVSHGEVRHPPLSGQGGP